MFSSVCSHWKCTKNTYIEPLTQAPVSSTNEIYRNNSENNFVAYKTILNVLYICLYTKSIIQRKVMAVTIF